MQDQQGKPVWLTNSYYTMLPIKKKKKLQTMPSNLLFVFHLWAYTVKKKKQKNKKLKRRKIHVSNKILVDLNNEHSICCSMIINKEDLYGLMHYYIWDGRANFKYWLLTRMKDLLCFLMGHTFGEKVRVIWHHRGSDFEFLQEKWGKVRGREKMISRNGRRRGSGFSRFLPWKPVRKRGV